MKLKRVMTFKKTVNVQMPTEKLDIVRNESFVAEFRMLNNDQLAQQAEESKKLTAKEQVARVLISVSGVGDPDDAENKEYPQDVAMELILDNTMTCLAALHEYNQAISKDILGKTAKTS